MADVTKRTGVRWLGAGAPDESSVEEAGWLAEQDVFAVGYIGDHSNIARVRLDSLGPGVPPD